MISRRGVAKKRRKQEPGVRTVKCSLTVAVTQQSWRQRQPLSALIGAEPRANPGLANVRVLLLPGDLQPDDETSDDCSCPEFAQRFGASRPHESRAGRTTRFAAVNSFDHSAATHANDCKLRRLTSRVRGGSRHFCASGTFCASSRHADKHRPRARRKPTSSISHDRTTPYAIYQRLFDRCRNAQMRSSIDQTFAFRVTIVPLPRANPPRAGPAADPFDCLLPQARVSSHASRLARAHHQDSQDSVVVVCSP